MAYKRIEVVPSMQISRQAWRLICLVPDDEKQEVLDGIGDYFDMVANRNTREKDLPDIPASLSRVAHEALKAVRLDLCLACDKYFEKADKNAGNRGGTPDENEGRPRSTTVDHIDSEIVSERESEKAKKESELTCGKLDRNSWAAILFKVREAGIAIDEECNQFIRNRINDGSLSSMDSVDRAIQWCINKGFREARYFVGALKNIIDEGS